MAALGHLRCLHSQRLLFVLRFAAFVLLFTPTCLSWYWGNLVVYVNSYYYAQTAFVDLHTSWLISVSIVSWSVSFIAAGCLERHFDRRLVITLGALLFVAAFFAGRLVLGVSATALSLTLGVLAGSGYGFVQEAIYSGIACIASGKAGVAFALLENFYNAGAMLFNAVITWYANPDNLEADSTAGRIAVFTDPSIIERVPSVFLLLGVMTSCFMLPGWLLSMAFKVDPSSDVQDACVEEGGRGTSGDAKAGRVPGDQSTEETKILASADEDATAPRRRRFNMYSDRSESSSARPENNAYLALQENSTQEDKDASLHYYVNHDKQQQYSSDTSSDKTQPPYSQTNKDQSPSSLPYSNEENQVSLYQNADNKSIEDDSCVDWVGDGGDNQHGDVKMGRKGISFEEEEEEGHSSQWEVLKQPAFYVVWFSLLVNDSSNLVLINFYKVFGQVWIEDDHFLTNLGIAALCITAVMRFLISLWMHRCSLKSMQVCLTSVMAVGYLFFSVTPKVSRWLYGAWTVGLTTACSTVYLTVPVITMRLFGRSRFGFHYALLTSGSMLVNILAPVVFQAALTHLSWDAIFMAVGALNCLSLLVNVMGLPRFG